jgi:hypothetical protein
MHPLFRALIFSIFFGSLTGAALAATAPVPVRIPSLRGELRVENFELLAAQPKVICRFESAPGAAWADQSMPEAPLRLALSRAKQKGRYRVELLPSDLQLESSTPLPLRSCALQLSVWGRKQGRSGEEIRGTLDLVGSALEDLPAAELEAFSQPQNLQTALEARLRSLTLRWNALTGRIEKVGRQAAGQAPTRPERRSAWR